MLFRAVLLILFLANAGYAQHTGFSFELQNEIGTHQLVSLTFSHKRGNTEGFTYVVNKQSGDTLYHVDQYLLGWVGLSRDGQTFCHLITEVNGVPLDKCKLSFYRNGIMFDEAELSRLISYQLKEAIVADRIPKSGWLKNDSILHKMANNPFYVSEDKVFISFDTPILSVFDMNQMFHIYTGNGANHFFQNYYSVPNAPFKTDYNWGEYLPKGFPKLISNEDVEDSICQSLSAKLAIPEDAKYRCELELKLNSTGEFEIRKSNVFSTISNTQNEHLSKQVAVFLENVSFQTQLVPPNHPAWIFGETFWMK
jgi:hypothetical protein